MMVNARCITYWLCSICLSRLEGVAINQSMISLMMELGMIMFSSILGGDSSCHQVGDKLALLF